MKRSEMVRYMAQVLMVPRVDYTERDPKEAWEMIASELLQAIEKQGMLPPEIDKVIEKHDCTVNEWEPEDEL